MPRNADAIRNSGLYEMALKSAKSGDSVSMTFNQLMEYGKVRKQVNEKQGEKLVTLALIVRQAHKDVELIDVDYIPFEDEGRLY